MPENKENLQQQFLDANGKELKVGSSFRLSEAGRSAPMIFFKNKAFRGTVVKIEPGKEYPISVKFEDYENSGEIPVRPEWLVIE